MNSGCGVQLFVLGCRLGLSVFIPPVCRVRAELVNFDGPCRILGCIQEGPLHVALPTSGPFTADRWASISVHLLQWKLLVLKPSDRKP